MPLQGWLWLDDCEIFNDARFEANVKRQALCDPKLGINWVKPVPENFSYDPCQRDTPTKLDYSDPTLNPWYDADHHDESVSFLGYWVEETTFDSTYSRNIEQRGATRPGANFSRLRREHREIAYKVLLAADNDYGLQWGFDWLSEKLAACHPLRLTTAMIRLSAGQPDAIWQDLWTLEGMGITDPLKWGEMPLPLAGCKFREASFVISASDPDRRTCAQTLIGPEYFYEPGTVPTECMDGMKWLCGPFPEERICVEMPGPGQLGFMDGIITIQAGSNGTPVMNIYGGINRWGTYECGDPRLELCMDIRIDNLAPHEKLIVDSTHERVWVSSPKTGFENVDAVKYLIPPEEGIPRYLQLANCESAWIWVEPYTACGLDDETTVTIDYVHRVVA
jgi:hypothetical protein